jgi:hypothetical protein
MQLVPQLHEAECKIKLNFVNWYLQGLYVGEMDTHTLCMVMKPGFSPDFLTGTGLHKTTL